MVKTIYWIQHKKRIEAEKYIDKDRKAFDNNLVAIRKNKVTLTLT